jgi:hypothetical protein
VSLVYLGGDTVTQGLVQSIAQSDLHPSRQSLDNSKNGLRASLLSLSKTSHRTTPNFEILGISGISGFGCLRFTPSPVLRFFVSSLRYEWTTVGFMAPLAYGMP